MHPSSSRSVAFLPTGTLIGLAVALAAVVISALITYASSATRERAVRSVTHTREVLQELEATLSSLKDAETGQRGYLLTQRDNYLEPYDAARAAVPQHLDRLAALIADNPSHLERMSELRIVARDKLADLQQKIDLLRAGNTKAAFDLVGSDRSKATMDRARQLIGEMRGAENTLLDTRNASWERAVRASQFLNSISTMTLIVLIGVAAVVMSRDFRARENQLWLRAGQSGLAVRLQGEQRIEVLGDRALSYLAEYLGAAVGAVYVRASSSCRTGPAWPWSPWRVVAACRRVPSRQASALDCSCRRSLECSARSPGELPRYRVCPIALAACGLRSSRSRYRRQPQRE